MEKEIKELVIGFENCEDITIPRNGIGEFLLDKIHPVVRRMACNSISKYWAASEVVMEIFKEADRTYHPFGCLDESNTLKRLSAFSDITSISVSYTDGTEETYLVDYDEGENEGQLGAENVNEDIYISDLGNVYIVIAKGKKVEDYFDKEFINNVKTTELRKDMMDIGIEEPEKVDISEGRLPDLYRYVYVNFSDGSQSLAVRVQNEYGSWHWVCEDGENEAKTAVSWVYPNSKIEEFLAKEYAETDFSIDAIRKKFSKEDSQ